MKTIKRAFVIVYSIPFIPFALLLWGTEKVFLFLSEVFASLAQQIYLFDRKCAKMFQKIDDKVLGND